MSLLSIFFFKIAFITVNSSLEPLLEGLFAQIHANLISVGGMSLLLSLWKELVDKHIHVYWREYIHTKMKKEKEEN